MALANVEAAQSNQNLPSASSAASAVARSLLLPDHLDDRRDDAEDHAPDCSQDQDPVFGARYQPWHVFPRESILVAIPIGRLRENPKSGV